MTREANSQSRPAGLPGPGFAGLSVAVLLIGLATGLSAGALGASPGVALGIIAGAVTAAVGTLSWWLLLRATYGRSPKLFMTGLLGGILFRMALYGAVLVIGLVSGRLQMGGLLATLFLSHLAYQSLEVTALHRARRRKPMPAVSRGALAAVLCVALTLAASAGWARAATDTSPAGEAKAQDTAHDAAATGSGHEQEAGDHAADTFPGETWEHVEEAHFDVMHHVVDSHELETPFGAVHLPQGWMVAGIDLAPTKHVVFMWIAGLITLIVVMAGARRVGMVSKGLGNALETVLLFIRDEIAAKNIGHNPEKFTPYLATLFCFILFCNLLGLVPFGATATGNLNVTAGLAVLSLLLIQGAGIRENGVVAHIKALCPIPHGVPGWLLPLYVPIIIAVEVVGIFTKPIALSLRLFANMTAGHVVIVSLLGLIFILQSHLVVPLSVAFALFIYCLEIFVGFVQAYIFTMLTALFIGMSQHPAH